MLKKCALLRTQETMSAYGQNLLAWCIQRTSRGARRLPREVHVIYLGRYPHGTSRGGILESALGGLFEREATEGPGVHEVERIDDHEHRDDRGIAVSALAIPAESLRDGHRHLVSGKTREAPCGKHRAVYLRDVRHAVVVRENRRNHREARAVAGVDDEKRNADYGRPEAERHDACGDRQDEEQDVDALREPVGPPREEEPAASVHKTRKRDDPRDELRVVSVDVGRAHHLFRERNEAESGGDVEEHEQPRLPEEAVLEKLHITELEGRDSVSEALHLDLRLLEEEARGDHGNSVENRIGVKDVRDAVFHESLKPERSDGDAGRAPVDSAEENRRQRRAESERNDRQSRRNRLVLREPQHHRLDGRDIDDAGAEPDKEAVAEVDRHQRLHMDADLGHYESGKKQRGANYRGEADVLLDDLAEESSAHAEEEDAQRKGKLHIFLRFTNVFGNFR